VVHLIRHAQSIFQHSLEAGRADPKWRDAPLSEEGLGQAQRLRREVASLGVELVVISPLSRALQTALAAFEGLGIPLLVQPLAREWLYTYCDVGRPRAELEACFPGLDFAHLAEVWWYEAAGGHEGWAEEPVGHVVLRIRQLVSWLEARPERSIAVVGHSALFEKMTGISLAHCGRVTLHL
jgi:broad specificity phosphatase PhoE